MRNISRMFLPYPDPPDKAFVWSPLCLPPALVHILRIKGNEKIFAGILVYPTNCRKFKGQEHMGQRVRRVKQDRQAKVNTLKLALHVHTSNHFISTNQFMPA